MYFVKKLLECSRDFEKYLMERQLHHWKSPLGGVGQWKVLCSHYRKTSLILRETRRSVIMRKTRRKKYKKAAAVTAKRGSSKTNTDQTSRRYNEEITIIVGWRGEYLHDLHAKFANQIDHEKFHWVQKVTKTVSIEVCQYDTKILPKMQLRCQF